METIVIRLWVPAPGDDASALSGVLEHPASGKSQPFTDRAELLRLLEERTRASSAAYRAGERG
jgi:hypothetical protein